MRKSHSFEFAGSGVHLFPCSRLASFSATGLNNFTAAMKPPKLARCTSYFRSWTDYASLTGLFSTVDVPLRSQQIVLGKQNKEIIAQTQLRGSTCPETILITAIIYDTERRYLRLETCISLRAVEPPAGGLTPPANTNTSDLTFT